MTIEELKRKLNERIIYANNLGYNLLYTTPVNYIGVTDACYKSAYDDEFTKDDILLNEINFPIDIYVNADVRKNACDTSACLYFDKLPDKQKELFRILSHNFNFEGLTPNELLIMAKIMFKSDAITGMRVVMYKSNPIPNWRIDVIAKSNMTPLSMLYWDELFHGLTEEDKNDLSDWYAHEMQKIITHKKN